jgi:hypothetical protein
MAYTAEQTARTPGQDTILNVRVRTANVAVLEAGVELGVDHLTGQQIQLQLLKRDDGTHDLLVVTNPFAAAGTPEPVDAVLEYPDEEAGMFDADWEEYPG